jgi:hypothetical protein
VQQEAAQLSAQDGDHMQPEMAAATEVHSISEAGRNVEVILDPPALNQRAAVRSAHVRGRGVAAAAASDEEEEDEEQRRWRAEREALRRAKAEKQRRRQDLVEAHEQRRREKEELRAQRQVSPAPPQKPRCWYAVHAMPQAQRLISCTISHQRRLVARACAENTIEENRSCSVVHSTWRETTAQQNMPRPPALPL